MESQPIKSQIPGGLLDSFGKTNPETYRPVGVTWIPVLFVSFPESLLAPLLRSCVNQLNLESQPSSTGHTMTLNYVTRPLDSQVESERDL